MIETYIKKKEEYQKIVDGAENLLVIMDLQEAPTEEGTEEETIDVTTVVVMSVLNDLDLLRKCYNLIQESPKMRITKNEMN